MSYADQVKHTNEQKLEALLKTLPSCCRIYLSSLTEEKASNTILAYARDLQVYFEYITREIPRFSDRPASALSTDEVGSITDPEADGFVLFLRSYKNKDGIRRTNSSAGAKRKIGTVRNFYRFFCESEVFDCNPMDVVATPKVTGPEGTRLDVSEAALLMDNVEFGNNLRGRQKNFHIREKNRDLALVYLMLSTGIRVSECVALDIDDIDTDERCLLLHKEGSAAAKIYYSDECNAYLMGYLDERLRSPAADPEDRAFFLSRNGARLSARSIQKLVKKYTSAITEKNVHPHVLRKTYGKSSFEKSDEITKEEKS